MLNLLNSRKEWEYKLTTTKPTSDSPNYPMRQLYSYIVVFMASGCVLTIEIVAGRMLAPIIGVSLYTWTSIIGIVLAGISLGNFLGGVIADRFPYRYVLGLILLASCLSSLSILPLIELVSEGFISFSVISRIVLVTTIVFILPSVMLGMVTPVVVKLRLNDLDKTGNIVGKLYAVSTAGSIFGTFITGFVLIQWMGTRSIVLTVTGLLLLLAIAFGRLYDMKITLATFVLLLVGLGIITVKMEAFRTPCLVESSYFCIRIWEEESNGRTVSVLALDRLVHSYVDLDDPEFLAYGYEKVFADLSAYVGENNPQFKSLFIGGGGYTMPRLIENRYPESVIEVVEIDPAVTEVAYKYLDMPRNTRIITYNRDARMMVQELQEERYDLIIGDAFNHYSVPYHLTTLEFNEMVKALLNEEGIYTVNVIDRLHSGRFLRAVSHTLEQSFDFVYIMHNRSDWSKDIRDTFVVAASDTPISLDKVNTGTSQNIKFTHKMPIDVYNSWIGAKKSILLTDAFVPVDNLLAPLFLEY